jgi:hypothetical protein
MYQWHRVTFLALFLLLAASAVQAEETTSLIPLGSDQSANETSVVLADKSSSGMTLQFKAPYVEITSQEKSGENFQLINMPGAELDGADGEPALPLITRLVAIPNGYTLRVKNVETQNQTLDGNFRPWPAQGMKDISDDSFTMDSQYYLGNKRVDSPALVTVGQPSLLRGERVVPVRFRPVVWTPSGGSLEAASEILVTFEMVASNDGNNSSAGRLIPESFASMYESEIIGYERNGEVMEGLGTYLLIHPDNATVLSNLQPLIDWRLRQGYNVVVASTAVTGTTTGSIKSYIQTQYNSLSIPLEFVALVGDANGGVTIPTYTEGLSGYNGEGDHEYTLLEGGDILSDVHLGRLSVTSTSMLNDVVSKIVKYESDPYLSDSGWFSRAGLTGDPGSSGYSCIWINQWVKHQLLDLNYTQVDTIWSGNFTTEMLATVNAGESIFTYRGYYYMSGMNSSHIYSMSNGEKLPFAMIPTCDTGSFRSDTDARSEAFFRNPNGGGIASIGTATTGTHTRYNNCMFQGVLEGVLNSGDSRVGPGLTRGKLHLYRNYNDRESTKVEIWSTWNNLMGDPATALWSGLPRNPSVDYPATITAGANSLPITVSNGSLPWAGARVTVFRKDHLQVSAITDANGHVNLPLSGLVSGEYMVTVTGRNLKPFLGGVNVGDLAASVNFATMNIDDDNSGVSQGNNDGLANAGEMLELGIDLTNHGTGGVSNISAQLVSFDPLISVDQASSEFGYISSGGTTSGLDNYVVSLDSSVPGGSVVSLELVATDGSETWTSLVDLPVSGPAAEAVGFHLSTGTINPGQSANLNVTIENIGNLATSDVTATLSSNSLWISVTDNSGSFGAIAAGGQSTNSFDDFAINAGVECYPGHVATLTLDLVFAEGGTASLPVLVTVGSASSTDPVGPDNHGYYAFDNTDTDYEFAPNYNWVEIAPTSGGQGVSVGLSDFGRYQDDVLVVDLPFAFNYYGKTFTKMSICSNGWISMGATNIRSYRNWTLPSAGSPDNMIAPFWDDLYVRSSNSGIYSWYDETGHRLILQWDNVGTAYSPSGDQDETFQIILEDPAYNAGDTGDGIITFNYQDVNLTDGETGYHTTGIQNEDRDDAVLYSYYNLHPGGATPLADGRSITFRTVVPQAQGTLRGMVSNAGNDAAIDGATVSVLGTGLSLMTTDEGLYQTNLTIGTYDVAVHHPSFAPDTTFGVVIQEEMETVVDFALVDMMGPVFAMQTIPESTDDTSGPYDVVFEVSDFSGIEETHFYYTSSTTGGPFELPLQPEGPADTWRVSIPGQADGTLVQYWMTSTDLLAFSSSEPAGAPFDNYSFMVAQTSVIYTSEMENASDWSGGIAGDNASSGLWTNVDPIGVFNGQTEISPEDDHSDPGTMCWITGQDPAGGEQGVNDVDGGTTTLQSPLFDISSYSGMELQYHRWYTNDTGYSPGEDSWVVQAQAQDGSWVNLENTTGSNRSWLQMNFVLAEHMTLGSSVQFRFVASDFGAGSVVEAGVDDFMLTSFPLIADGEAPVVSVVTPNGGESAGVGSVLDIDWNQSDDIGVVHVEILLSTNGGADFDHVIAEGAFNGTFSWTVEGPAGSTNRVKIICHDSAGNSTEAVSAGNFTIGGVSAVGDLPSGRVALAQNAPNPFNPRTEIKFSVPTDQDVTLRIYNVEGRLVRTLLQGRQIAGTHSLMWSGQNDQGGMVASGLYFYRLSTDSGTLTRKMTLLK